MFSLARGCQGQAFFHSEQSGTKEEKKKQKKGGTWRRKRRKSPSGLGQVETSSASELGDEDLRPEKVKRGEEGSRGGWIGVGLPFQLPVRRGVRPP